LIEEKFNYPACNCICQPDSQFGDAIACYHPGVTMLQFKSRMKEG